MNQPSSAYRRQWLGIDNSVWIVILCVTVIGIITLGFRLIKNTPCEEIQITTKGTAEHDEANFFFPNEKIDFLASMKNARYIEWDFGDSSEVSLDSVATHAYANEGNYLVTLKINDKCSEFFRILIRRPKTNLPDKGNTDQNNSVDSNNLFTVNISDYDLGPLPDRLNLDSMALVKKQSLTNFEMKNWLMEFVEGKKEIPDFAPFLCQGEQTRVEANGKPLNFAQLCYELRKLKRTGLQINKKTKATVKSAEQLYEPDASNKCVSLLKVKYEW
jgi:hypothetical protein